MEQKLYDILTDGEKVLWSGKPEFKILGETHKKFFAAKVVVIAFALIAFFMYYFIGVKEGTIPFKASVLVIMGVIAAVPLMLEWLDAQKMKKTIYAVTDKRLISLVDTAVNALPYDRIKEYKFAEDADGQVSLVCGCDMMKKNPRSYRASAVFGLRMKDDNSECERFVMYAIPEADKVKKLVAKLVK